MTEPIDLNIEALAGGLDEPQWVECEAVPGLALRLRLPDTPEMLAMTSRVLSASDHSSLKYSDGQTADLLLSKVRLAVVDWRGLTAGALGQLLPAKNLVINGADGGPLPAEQPLKFSPKLRDILLRRSQVIFYLVVGWLHDQEKQEQAAEKNSSATPNITPTATPAPASGAKKSKRTSA